MHKEACDFAAVLKKLHKAIKDMGNASQQLLSITKMAMVAPLPLSYEESKEWSGVTNTPTAAPVGGPEFNADSMTEASQCSLDNGTGNRGISHLSTSSCTCSALASTSPPAC
jgi:hypothetical protein